MEQIETQNPNPELDEDTIADAIDTSEPIFGQRLRSLNAIPLRLERIEGQTWRIPKQLLVQNPYAQYSTFSEKPTDEEPQHHALSVSPILLDSRRILFVVVSGEQARRDLEISETSSAEAQVVWIDSEFALLKAAYDDPERDKTRIVETAKMLKKMCDFLMAENPKFSYATAKHKTAEICGTSWQYIYDYLRLLNIVDRHPLLEILLNSGELSITQLLKIKQYSPEMTPEMRKETDEKILKMLAQILIGRQQYPASVAKKTRKKVRKALSPAETSTPANKTEDH